MAAQNGAFAGESLDIHGASKESVGAACQEFISKLLRGNLCTELARGS